jgi:uncharacterized membrane-anchored protein
MTRPIVREAHVRVLGKVPEITLIFWLIKGLSTAMGESTSDYLVHAMSPVVAVLLGFAAFVVALALQMSRRRYHPAPYWLAVVMVGVFGTMAADVLHVGFGVPYAASAILYAIVLAGVFVAWHRSEGTLSIHSIRTTRREGFYWAAVVATFAMGTALGDLTGTTLPNGYLLSAGIYASVIAVPAIGYRLGWNPVLTFWWAYVMTRPLGASLADWMGKPVRHGGLGWGDGPVSIGLTLVIIALVTILVVRERGRDRDRGSVALGPVQAA